MASPLTGGQAYRRAGDTGPASRGCTVLLRGERGAGRSTLAAGLAERLRAEGHRVEELTGDRTLSFLSTAEERRQSVVPLQRLGFVAALLARNQIKVLCPFPAHDEKALGQLRTFHRECNVEVVEVYVAAAQLDVPATLVGETLMARWPELFAGSETPDLIVPAGEAVLFQAVSAIYNALVERGLA